VPQDLLAYSPNVLGSYNQRIAIEVASSQPGTYSYSISTVVGVLASIGDSTGTIPGIRLTDAFVYRRVLDGVYERDTDPVECFIPATAIVLVRYATADERASVDDAFAARTESARKAKEEEFAEYATTDAAGADEPPF
jgi:hypothetical protein